VSLGEKFMEDNLKNKELNALISLLDEPDDEIFSHVRERLFSYGNSAIPLLEDAWDTSYDNNSVQHRIEGIIHDIQFDNVFKELSKWKNTPEQHLITGFMTIARYQYPELNEKLVTAGIGKIIQDVWLELNNDLTPLEKVKVINHILFDIHGFMPNKNDIYEPKNSYLNTLLEIKKGNAISLSIIYLAVSQSLNIPVYGINLPQNFVMAFLDKMIVAGEKISSSNVLFYINAYNGGAVFTRREIDLFLRQINVENDEKYYLPCDNSAIMKRVLNNLIVGYENKGKISKAEELKKLQKALD
jgi:regulator of sirC expression with transglutaminase-like and TPR domain